MGKEAMEDEIKSLYDHTYDLVKFPKEKKAF